MNDGEALRRAVIANRDDDTPRLIYADWLDENGQSNRAAFIRAQVDVARAEPFSPLARAAESKAHLLLESHRKDWTRHLHGRTLDIPRFQRGFIEHVAVKPIPIESVASIFDIEPLKSLRIVRLNDDDEWQTIDSVLKLPQLFQINRLELSNLNRFEHHEYQTLLTSPNLSNIRELSLRNSAVQPSWFVEMLSGNAFQSQPTGCGRDHEPGAELAASIQSSESSSTAVPRCLWSVPGLGTNAAGVGRGMHISDRSVEAQAYQLRGWRWSTLSPRYRLGDPMDESRRSRSWRPASRRRCGSRHCLAR